jgi:hypothetical protein
MIVSGMGKKSIQALTQADFQILFTRLIAAIPALWFMDSQ